MLDCGWLEVNTAMSSFCIGDLEGSRTGCKGHIGIALHKYYLENKQKLQI